MKKVIYLFFAAVSIFAFTACGGGETATEETATEETVAEEAVVEEVVEEAVDTTATTTEEAAE